MVLHMAWLKYEFGPKKSLFVLNKRDRRRIDPEKLHVAVVGPVDYLGVEIIRRRNSAVKN